MAGCAANKTTGTAYCGVGECAADLQTGKVYWARTQHSGATADFKTGIVYCANSSGKNPSPSNYYLGSVSICKLQ